MKLHPPTVQRRSRNNANAFQTTFKVQKFPPLFPDIERITHLDDWLLKRFFDELYDVISPTFKVPSVTSSQWLDIFPLYNRSTILCSKTIRIAAMASTIMSILTAEEVKDTFGPTYLRACIQALKTMSNAHVAGHNFMALSILCSSLLQSYLENGIHCFSYIRSLQSLLDVLKNSPECSRQDQLSRIWGTTLSSYIFWVAARIGTRSSTDGAVIKGSGWFFPRVLDGKLLGLHEHELSTPSDGGTLVPVSLLLLWCSRELDKDDPQFTRISQVLRRWVSERYGNLEGLWDKYYFGEEGLRMGWSCVTSWIVRLIAATLEKDPEFPEARSEMDSMAKSLWRYSHWWRDQKRLDLEDYRREWGFTAKDSLWALEMSRWAFFLRSSLHLALLSLFVAGLIFTRTNNPGGVSLISASARLQDRTYNYLRGARFTI